MRRHVRWDGLSEAEQKDRASGEYYLVFVSAALEGARCVRAAATDAFV